MKNYPAKWDGLSTALDTVDSKSIQRQAAANDCNLHALVGRCKSCQHFERGHWLPEYGGGEQKGGNCKALCKVLGLTNSCLVWHDAIYVQETFGCSLFSPNRQS